jgi:hypothetical protein
MKQLLSLISLFVILWLVSAIAVPFFAGSLDSAGNFGDSFGGVSALFSGLALALAIYSMVLQQKQSAEFEKVTLATLGQQAVAIKLIEASLTEQASAARVAALSTLIDREEQRIETLRQWGTVAGDETKYTNGIKSAQKRVDEYQNQLRKHAGG